MTPALPASLSRREARRRLEVALAAAGLAEPRTDAAILCEAATGLSRVALLADDAVPMGPDAADRLAAFAARRLAREPVFRILGRRPFWTLDLTVTPDVLDPRPDTETVVDAALAAMKGREPNALRVLDLGTGSGAILCALLAEWPAAFGVGVDRSLAACRVALGNVATCGFADRAAVLQGDWAGALGGPFDVVVSNPPYIETAALRDLDPEVRRHDPVAALDGGADGLDAYRALAPTFGRLLAPGGVVVVEVGWTQAGVVSGLLAANGLRDVETRHDLGGHARVVSARVSASCRNEGPQPNGNRQA